MPLWPRGFGPPRNDSMHTAAPSLRRLTRAASHSWSAPPPPAQNADAPASPRHDQPADLRRPAAPRSASPRPAEVACAGDRNWAEPAPSLARGRAAVARSPRLLAARPVAAGGAHQSLARCVDSRRADPEARRQVDAPGMRSAGVAHPDPCGPAPILPVFRRADSSARPRRHRNPRPRPARRRVVTSGHARAGGGAPRPSCRRSERDRLPDRIPRRDAITGRGGGRPSRRRGAVTEGELAANPRCVSTSTSGVARRAEAGFTVRAGGRGRAGRVSLPRR